jgi:hypothetical protein
MLRKSRIVFLAILPLSSLSPRIFVWNAALSERLSA